MSYLTRVMPLTQVEKPPFTVEVPGATPVAGETIPRRHPRAKDGLLERPADDISTVYDFVRRGAEHYASEPAVGSRKLIKMHKEMKKVDRVVDGEVRKVDKEWQYFELGKYSFLTYTELQTLVLQVGAGLRKLGLAKGDKLHLFATTR